MTDKRMVTEIPIEESPAYAKLLAQVEKDASSSDTHDYRGKLNWVVERAQHYADQTGLRAAEILAAWEAKRSYWYMNFYQDSNQPLIKNTHVFDTVEDFFASLDGKNFRCPNCGGVSSDPNVCTTGLKVKDKVCDWKSYGLFGTMGKGANVFVKDRMENAHIFFPVAWEKPNDQ